ncbi:hypothetical protein ABIE27_000377 [Paenibacillus sp. 4624]|uniref:hypothetical protein n=1 Tax=Paenibacillus sp. 4624 TaxID=3156453 RepID=UPI003D203306
MVDEAIKLGELLKLPNLEQETITLINGKMREMIGEIKPLTPAQKAEVESLMNEWMGGEANGQRNNAG